MAATPSERISSVRAIAAAAAIHAGILAALVAAPLPRRTAVPQPAAPSAEEAAIELDDPPADVVARTLVASAASVTEHEAASTPRPREERRPEPTPAASSPAPIAPPQAPRDDDGSSAPLAAAPVATIATNAAPHAIGLAGEGVNPFLAPGALPDMRRGGEARGAPPAPTTGNARPATPTPAEAKLAAEAVLRAPARDREREIGLGPEGPVLEALAEAAYGSATAVQGRAVFVAVADATGMVVGLDVLSSDGGHAAWTDAARLALGSLRGKKLRLPSSAKGAEMRIEVTSALKMPTGHDPGTDVDLFHIPIAKGSGPKSTKVSVLDPIPKLRVDQLEVAPGVKVPVVSFGLDALAISGDPANIGAKPRRIVHTRLVGSKVL